MAGTATLRSNIEKLTIPQLVGLTVAQARTRFGAVINISGNANPMLNGSPVEGSHVIEEGEEILFTVALGEKGV